MNDRYIGQKENIKDCPFCGCSVSVERVPLQHYKGCVIFKIKCLNCGCERVLMKNDSVYRTEEEARANAIAQWNERSSTPTIPQEMSAREYMDALQRLFIEDYYVYNTWCKIMLSTEGDKRENLHKAIAFVETWVKEHPKAANDE